MSTYFAYSDEYGAYKKEKKYQFLKAHPFYIRSVILLESSEWKTLNTQVVELKKTFNIPQNREIKWSYLWSLRNHAKTNTPIKPTQEYYFLKDFDYHDLIDYVEKCITTYTNLNYKKIFFTITENTSIGETDEQIMYKMHLTNIAQRLQYEFQSHNDLAVLFLDTVNNNIDNILKKSWHQIYCDGDFVKKYSCIKSSTYIEYSNQSIGIQIADYIAGAIGSFFISKKCEGYDCGVSMFNKYILPNLRRENSTIIGFGILNVPTQPNFKKTLHEYFENPSN
jgi:hypothetical protein